MGNIKSDFTKLSMKKILFALLLTAFCISCNFAQATKQADKTLPEKKAKTHSDSKEKDVAGREKFDPLRNASEDLKSAITKAQAENKRIILDVGGEWCGWCRLMDNYLIKNVELGRMRDDNYVWVKINMSPENENAEFLSKYPEIKGYPHLFVLEKDGALIKSKDTSELEEGESYNLQKFNDFLKEYAPVKDSNIK